MDRASASGKFTEEVPPPPPRGGGLSLTSSKQKIPGSTPGMVKRGRSRLTAGFLFCFVLFFFFVLFFCFVLNNAFSFLLGVLHICWLCSRFSPSPPARAPEGSRPARAPCAGRRCRGCERRFQRLLHVWVLLPLPPRPGASPVPHGSQLKPLPQEPAEGLGQRPGVPEQKVEVKRKGVEVEFEDGLPRLELHGLHPRQ